MLSRVNPDDEAGPSRLAVAPVYGSTMSTAILDPRTLIQPQPIGSVNVKNSKEVTFGTKILNITVDNREKVTDLPFYAYLWNRIKSTSQAERYACGIISVILLICLALALFFSLRQESSNSGVNASKERDWYINRTEWLAEPARLEDSDRMSCQVPLVVINHSAGAPCMDFLTCATEMRYHQQFYINEKKWVDGPYNFAIGTDGRVYEGRGWKYAAAHTFAYNKCALGIGFLGDYRTEGRQTEVTGEQVVNMFKILQIGVDLGYLRSDYVIVGHRDIRDSDSPGDKLMNVMMKWTQYNTSRYRGMSCEQIMGPKPIEPNPVTGCGHSREMDVQF